MKKLRDIVLAVAMLLCMVIGASHLGAYPIATAIFSDEITIQINGQAFEGRAVIINNVIYVPIRALGYAVNATTTWDGKNKKIILKTAKEKLKMEKITQTLDGRFNAKKAYFTDDIQLIIDGKRVQLDSPIAIVEGRSYLPIKEVAEEMGVRVTWYGEEKLVKVVNSKIMIVDDALEAYYIRDLPRIKVQEDYLIGNWQGKIEGKTAKYRSSATINSFISKNKNGTYTVITNFDETWYDLYTNKILEDHIIGTVRYIGYYNAKTQQLKCTPTKVITSSTGEVKPNQYATVTYLLKDEVLYLDGIMNGYNDNKGRMDRF